MKVQELSEGVYAMMLQPSEEIINGLLKIPELSGCRSGFFWGIGALSEVTIGWFDKDKQEYKKRTVKSGGSTAGGLEILSLMGNLGVDEEDKPIVHAHIMVGDSEQKVLGGHLFKGIISVTLELLFISSKEKISRKKGLFGLKLWDL